jgi:hypothetical protein
MSSCKSKFEYHIDNYSDFHFKKIEIKDLINNSEYYDGKYVNIEGYFYGNINQVTIHSKKQSSNGIVLYLSKEKLYNVNGEQLSIQSMYSYDEKYINVKGIFNKDIQRIGFSNGAIEVMYFGGTSSCAKLKVR